MTIAEQRMNISKIKPEYHTLLVEYLTHLLLISVNMPQRLWMEIDRGKWILPIKVKEKLKDKMEEFLQVADKIKDIDSERTKLGKNEYLSMKADDLLDLIQTELEKSNVLFEQNQRYGIKDFPELKKEVKHSANKMGKGK
jgi:hypothetical protein